MSDMNLTPTQELILEVLGARYRLGETAWHFSTRLGGQVKRLKFLGLVTWKSASIEKHLLVWLTEKGRQEVLLDGYVTPNDRALIARLEKRRDSLEGDEGWTLRPPMVIYGMATGMDLAIEIVRRGRE